MKITCVILLGLILHACGLPDAPKPPGQEGEGQTAERNFARLLNQFLEAKTTPTPWAGSWWPYQKDGIASGDHWYSPHSSPASKLDAVRAQGTSARDWEREHHGGHGAEQWWGHCNGWSVAACLFKEPAREIRAGGKTFGVADIKALITELGMEATAEFYGHRVDDPGDYTSAKYFDIVPDQLFLVLTNFLGRQGRALILDRYTGSQVWNQPIAGYRFAYPTRADYLGAAPEAPGVYRIDLGLTIWWVRDDVEPGAQTPPFQWADSETISSRTFRMELWLDGPVLFSPQGRIESSGDVIVTSKDDRDTGGAWKMGSGYNDAWPDYVWMPLHLDPSTGYSNPHVDQDWVKKTFFTQN